MNTERLNRLQTFTKFAQVAAPRQRLTHRDLELPILPCAMRATSPQPEHPQRGTAPRATYFVEVYAARPVSRVPGCSATEDLVWIQEHLCHRFDSDSPVIGRR
jgi:hypothetical protein